MKPFESTESTEGESMARCVQPLQPKRIVGSTACGWLIATATLMLCAAEARSGGFDEQFVGEPASVLSVGDRPDVVIATPETDALVELPESLLIEPLSAPDAVPFDAESTATLSDFGGDCPGSGACTCGRCAVNDGTDAGLIQRIRERNECRTTKVRTEAILLFRGPPANRPLFTTYNEATQLTGPTILNGNQLASDPLAAPRLVLERTDECGRGLEGAFLYAGNFTAYKELPVVPNGYAFAPPGIYGNTWGANNTPLSAAQSTLVANLYSAEVNLRSPIGFGATRFLGGFRWLQWGENWVLSDQFQDPADPTVVGADSFTNRCINNLYGGQIGLDTLLWNRGDGFRVESLVKAGAYYNAAAQSSSYDYNLNTGFAFSRAVAVNGAGSCSFVGEVGLTAVMPVSRNIDVRCGYFGLWLEGIAQPLNQLTGQTLTQIDEPAGLLNTAGTVVAQGLSLALEGRW